MTTSVAELRQVSSSLSAAAGDHPESVDAPLAALETGAKEVGKAWSGSWIGYQAYVYYRDFQPPPPRDHFSSEWGFFTGAGRTRTTTWVEFRPEDIEAAILRLAGNPDLTAAQGAAERAAELFHEALASVRSILQLTLRRGPDPLLEELLKRAQSLNLLTAGRYLDRIAPAQLVSRDSLAIHQGQRTPPHLAQLARVAALRSPRSASEALAKIATQAADHLERSLQVHSPSPLGGRVFIGHGQANVWKDLRDFLEHRLKLPWDEFNRVPVAGVGTTHRLSEMLDAAGFAFLVLTAEDESADGAMQPRMNVVHEVGLFQGKLGISRAIVLLEEGCSEFSNIRGLGQIRFPAGRIDAKFEEVRRVLEKAGLIPATGS